MGGIKEVCIFGLLLSIASGRCLAQYNEFWRLRL